MGREWSGQVVIDGGVFEEAGSVLHLLVIFGTDGRRFVDRVERVRG
jgi:hypothetical protein